MLALGCRRKREVRSRACSRSGTTCRPAASRSSRSRYPDERRRLDPLPAARPRRVGDGSRLPPLRGARQLPRSQRRLAPRPCSPSMFMHGSWMHLLGNMLFLWIFGNNVEDALGPGPLPRLLSARPGSPRRRRRRFVTLELRHRRRGASSRTSARAARSPACSAPTSCCFPRARVLTLIFFFLRRGARVLFLGLWFVFQLLDGQHLVRAPRGGRRRRVLRAHRRLRLRHAHGAALRRSRRPLHAEVYLMTFEEHVRAALDSLPPQLAAALENVAVVVEDEHPDDPDLYGLYEGCRCRSAGHAGSCRIESRSTAARSSRTSPTRPSSSERSASPSCTSSRTTSASTRTGSASWATTDDGCAGGGRGRLARRVRCGDRCVSVAP